MNLLNEIYENVKEEKELYLELGRTLISRNKFRKAIEFLLEAKNMDGELSRKWEVYYLLGEAYKSLSKTKQAFESFIEAAVCAREFKLQCFQEAKNLINHSTANDFHLWLKDETNLNFDSSLTDEDKKELTQLSAYSNSLIKKNQHPEQANLVSQIEIKNLVDEAVTFVNNNQYRDALKKIEEALSRDPGNYEILFQKIRILIEGQIDISAAIVLFKDEEFGYQKEYDDSETVNKLHRLLETNSGKGDTYFFAAFILNLLQYDRTTIKTWLEKAEKLGLKNGNAYPLLGLYLLKGKIAQKEGNTEDAGTNYLEVAKSYYWQANYTEASKNFEKVLSLNTKLIEAYNYYADTLLLLSYQPDPPYNNMEFVDKAFNNWHRSTGKIVQTKYDAWHYIVIARIHEIKYKFNETNFQDEYWQSILYAERAIIHNDTDFSLWTYLGMFYRNLSIEFNSLACFEEAAKINPEGGFMKEEKVILQLNMGDYEAPQAYLDELKEKELKENKSEGDKTKTIKIYRPYHKSWEGFIKFQHKELEHALNLFDEVIREENTNLFAHQMKMLSHWHALEFEKAQREASEIINLGTKYTYLKEEFTFSWADFLLGQTEKAITRFEDFNIRGKTTTENLFSLLQFYLYKGEAGLAEKSFDGFLQWTYNKRTLEELLPGFIILEKFIERNNGDVCVLKELVYDKDNGWKKRIEDKMEFLRLNPPSVKEELINKQHENEYKEGSIPSVTIQAGFARLHWKKKELFKAYQLYLNLKIYGDLFPEAQVAMEKIEEEVSSTSRAFIKNSKYAEAVQHLLPFSSSKSNSGYIIMTLLSLAYFGNNEEEKSLNSLKAAMLVIESKPELQKEFLAEIIDKAYNSKLTWNFGNFLKTNLKLSGSLNDIISKANIIEDLWNKLVNKFNFLLPALLPIAVDISDDLVSPLSESPDWHVIKELIPAMKKRIHQKYGISPPGIRIRGNNVAPDSSSYTISLDEIPLVSGTVVLDKLFVTGSDTELQIISLTGDPGWNPVSGEISMWVDTEYKELLDKNKIGYWEDPFDYIIAHVESVLTHNLEMFVDAQFCNEYLSTDEDKKEKGIGENTYELSKSIRSDHSFLILFTQMLRGLLKEKVPVTNKLLIIQSFIEAKKLNNDVKHLIQYVRIKLKQEIPANNFKVKAIELPSAIEKIIKEELQTAEGKTFLAMSPGNCSEVLSEIGNIKANNPDNEKLVLVTNDSILRIHLKKLVELEFPSLDVVSREELIENQVT